MDAHTYLELKNTNHELKRKFEALISQELAWYESEALELFKLKKLPNRNSEQIIQQTFGKSPNDAEKKRSKKDFYVANTIAFLQVIRQLLSQDFIKNFSKIRKSDDLVNYNYHRILQHLLFDSLIILNQYSERVLKSAPQYGVGKNPCQHTMTLYQSLRQSIYGQASFHSFIEVEPDLSISIIRQIIELRTRRAFGILGWYDSETKSMEPLPMSVIFNVLKKYEQDIELGISLSSIIRIYGWSNIFLHTGFKEYSWMHIFATEFIKPLAIGVSARSSVNSGVKVSQPTLEAIIDELESNHPKGSTIIRLKPDAEIKNLS